VRGNEPDNYTGAIVYRLAEGNTGCELTIKHRKIKAKKLSKPRRRMLRITGGEGFNPHNGIDLGPLTWRKIFFNKKKNNLKILVIVPEGLQPGSIPISVGDCHGTVEILGDNE